MVMFYDNNIKEYSDINYKINKLYCEKYNLDIILSQEKTYENRHSAYERLPLILKHIDNYDYVIWIDADAFFYITSKNIIEIINNNINYNFIFSKDITNDILNDNIDYNYINSGIFIVKNTKYSIEFINKWAYDEELYNNNPEKLRWVQGILNNMYNNNILDIKNNSILYKYGILQHFNKNEIEILPIQPFIYHLAGKSYEERLKASRNYYNIILYNDKFVNLDLIKLDLIKEYESKNNETLKYLDDLKTIIINSNTLLEGNCFYHHITLNLYEDLYTKQLNLFWSGKQAKTKICEIGFNAGHSTLLMLLGRNNTPLEFTIFDIGHHNYTKPCLEYIKSKFTHINFEYIEGDSTIMIPKWINSNNSSNSNNNNNNNLFKSYDVIHVDGGHTEHCISNDMKYADLLIKNNGIIIIDDTNDYNINKYVDLYINSGNYIELNILKTIGYPHRIIKKIIDSDLNEKSYYITNFNENEVTPLCEIMGRNKSDKGNINRTICSHNYTTFYYHIFKNIRHNNLRIFELGLGTNNIYMASNMGYNGRPGASLYGWSEFFSNSKIYGADIDGKILFNTNSIKTYYCDQTNPYVIKYMWNEAELKEDFDIIIEDGLHTFSANVCFFENSIHKLAKNGYYIIEDININEIQLFNNKINDWKKQFKDLLFILLQIPYHNKIDNNLLIIKKL